MHAYCSTMTVDVKAELNEPYVLSEQQIESYEQLGFIRLKQVFSPQLLEYYRQFVEEAVRDAGDGPLDEQLAKDRQDDSYARAFRQVINCWRTHPKVKELALSRRLGHIAAQLTRSPRGVRVYHDQALFKTPKTGGHTPYHADQYYWPLSSDKTVTAWIPLVPVSDDMGPLEFVCGSHRVDLGRAVGIGVESDRVIGEAVQNGGFKIAKGAFELGEVSFHSGWTFHRAAGNTSETERKVFTCIYMDMDMKMTKPVNANQEADAARYLQGISPGEVCAGASNPLAYEVRCGDVADGI